MSLAMDIDTIESVLIGGKWYKVLEQSFDLDAYEFLEIGQNWKQTKSYPLNGGEVGCTFTTIVNDSTTNIFAPLRSVQAVTISEELKRTKAKEMKEEKRRAEEAEEEEERNK